jgi:monoamine oxidase
MAGSSWFRSLRRIVTEADFCEQRQLSTREGIEEFSARESRYRLSRREFIAGAGKLAAGTAVIGLAPLVRAVAAPPPKGSITVGIVGAGLAGLSCAYELKRRGIIATLFDANDRAGGRCWSLPDFFPGQVAERGGEFIDTPHKTLLGYIREFKLAVEDVDKQPRGLLFFQRRALSGIAGGG